MTNSVIPGHIWWSVYCWLEHCVERGELEAFWFHDDVVLHVEVGEIITYRVGLLPLGRNDQVANTN